MLYFSSCLWISSFITMKILCSKFLWVRFLLVYGGKNLSISGLSLIRSQSQMQAVFLRHEGYLGALGALMSYGDPSGENLTLEEKVSFNKDILCTLIIAQCTWNFNLLLLYIQGKCFYPPVQTSSVHAKVNQHYNQGFLWLVDESYHFVPRGSEARFEFSKMWIIVTTVCSTEPFPTFSLWLELSLKRLISGALLVLRD